jgi:hypothetical protein
MTQTGAWEIDPDDQPSRLTTDREFLERHLETWIEREPSLLGSDIRWVARQLYLPDGSILDLLGVAADGTWVIAELKSGAVGTGAVLQAMHYYVELANMTNGQLLDRVLAQGRIDEAHIRELHDSIGRDRESTDREYRLMVAGVGAGEAAERAAETLKEAGFKVRVAVVSFQIVSASGGRRVLLREIDDQGEGPSTWTLESVLARAEAFGVRNELEKIQWYLESVGYRTYLKQYGLNFNQSARRQTFFVKPVQDAIHVGYLASSFPYLFGVDEMTAEAELGDNWRTLSPTQALETMHQWVATIEDLKQRFGPVVTPQLA